MLPALIGSRFRWSGGHGAAAVFAFALVLRLVYLGEIEDSPFFDAPVVDARTYADAARELAAGAWLGPDAPFWQPPLYPYFLGAVWSLLGVGWVAPRVLQALLGGLTCVLLWRLGCRTLSAPIGLAAALAAALWGPLVLFGGELLPAVVAVPLDLAALLLLLYTAEASSPAVRARRALLSGAVMGVAALCVANLLAFVPVAAAWLWRRRSAADVPSRLAPGMVVLGAALAVAPVTVRNLVVGQDLVLISSNAGVNAYIGNNPDFERTLEIQPGTGLAGPGLASRGGKPERSPRPGSRGGSSAAPWTSPSPNRGPGFGSPPAKPTASFTAPRTAATSTSTRPGPGPDCCRP